MNSALTLNASRTAAAPAASTRTGTVAAKTLVVSQIARTLARKGDMIAVVALMASSAAYGVYAITQMTGF